MTTVTEPTTSTTGVRTTSSTDLGAWLPVRRGGFSVRTRITTAVALLVLLALGAAGLLVYLLGLERIEQTVPAETRQELAELREFERNGIDPDTGRSFTSVERLVVEFLQRNVPSPSELMVGVWGDELRRHSLSSRDAVLDDPDFVEAVLSRTLAAARNASRPPTGRSTWRCSHCATARAAGPSRLPASWPTSATA